MARVKIRISPKTFSWNSWSQDTLRGIMYWLDDIINMDLKCVGF